MSHPVSVYAEMTPNPEVMKFVADRALIEGNAQAEFTSKAECSGHSSLAEELFNFPFVAGVFISGNFVSVTKDDTIGWEMITMQMRATMAFRAPGFGGKSAPTQNGNHTLNIRSFLRSRGRGCGLE